MTTAKLFQNGRSQAVRLPRDFRFTGNEVRVRRFGQGVLLEPVTVSTDDWFAALDRYRSPFMQEGRDQPKSQTRDALD